MRYKNRLISNLFPIWYTAIRQTYHMQDVINNASTHFEFIVSMYHETDR